MRLPRYPLQLLALGLAAACSDPSGPGLNGPPFFNATVNGSLWSPEISQGYCVDADLDIYANRSASPSTGSEVLVVSLGDLPRLGSFNLGDSASGRSAIFVVFPLSTGSKKTYSTRSQDPGQIKITGLDLTDSLVAGTFQFRATDITNPTDQRTIAGEFRLRLFPVYTVEHPQGSPCLVPPSAD